MSPTSKITPFFIRCPNLDILHRWFNAGQSSKSSKAVIQFGQSLHTSISTFQLEFKSSNIIAKLCITLQLADNVFLCSHNKSPPF